jgi:penicillin V acylase-like amidase (Ntn superfamily)
MCTIVVWSDNGIANVSARNMDWFEDMQTDLWVFPRGMAHKGLEAEGACSLDWTSKYGSVIASVYGIASSDGINEKGLGAHLLWLSESDYGVQSPAVPGLSMSLWGQFFLDNFASVAEAVAYAEQRSFQIVTSGFSSTDEAAAIHLQIEDASGDVAVFEYIDGELQIHHGSGYRVMTNSPIFEKQLANLKHYAGFGGDRPLPGTSEAADRFVRAAYYLEHLRRPASELEAIAGVISVVRNTAQPFVDLNREHAETSPTIWRTVIDHKNQTYYFESTVSPYLIWVELGNLDFDAEAPVLKPPLSTKLYDYKGDSTDRFIEAEPFPWSMP